MKLPDPLQKAIDKLFESVSSNDLKKARSALREDYLQGKVSPFEDPLKRLAYLGARMPATFAAVRKALSSLNLSGHLLDLGAGLGSASWAAVDLFPGITQVSFIEKNKDAISLGKKLAEGHPLLKKALWLKQSLEDPIPQADVAILSYVVGELKDPISCLEKIFHTAATLILVEPGTPKAFALIKKLREKFLSWGASLLAPCPHQLSCPNDWCHFAARVERSRIHKQIKEGSLGYEDEKFCYLAVSKQKEPLWGSRIVRRPEKGKGFVRLGLCTNQGTLQEITVSKKDKEQYREAKKADWGDRIKILQ